MSRNDNSSGSRPAISVVIPAYNSAATIREALTSVDAQAFSDYEVIIVDDRSSDETPKILRTDYSDTERYRFILREENGGPAASRNEGVSVASGEWIAFIDADDTWLPGRLESQIALMSRFPSAAMFCGGRSGEQKSDIRVLQPVDFIENNPVATSTVLIKRSVFDEVGGFDEQFRGPEDLDLWLRVAANHQVVMDSQAIAGYKSEAGSLSMDERRFLPEVLRVLDKAFAEGGALSNTPELKKSAVSTQLWNASWMAFSRGARGTAIAYWFRAYLKNRQADAPIERQWFRLLARYIAGRP